MSYTRPLATAADTTWIGASAYTRPSASAADASFSPPAPAYADAALTAVVLVIGALAASHGVSASASAAVSVTASIEAEFIQTTIEAEIAAVVPVVAAIVAAIGASAAIVAQVPVAGASSASHGVAGTIGASVAVAASITALHERYELAGEVRVSGVLVNRRVRAYRRDTGALVGQVDTVAGRFRVPAGFFASVEHYVVPVDLDESATDWTPAVANRVLPVLAMDA